MKPHPLAERRVIELVERGELAVDSFGRVWRLAVRRGTKNGGTALGSVTPRRAESVATNGYLQVRATVDGRRWYACAHRLVWQRFHGPIPDGLTINHRDGIKTNNRPSNLELATDAEQAAHAIALGLRDDEGRRLPNGRYGRLETAA